MEGFICPECKVTFQTIGLLENHFNTHFEGPSIKSILSKAKDYTLSWIANDGDSAGSYPSATEGDGGGGPGWSTGSSTPTELLYTDQSIGRANNLTKVFKAVRPKRISHSQKEANKLHLRLDKLVTALVSEIQAGKKNLKDVEKSVIPWNDTSDTCVSCSEILSVLSRKHHCRLCSGILCSSCSKLVPLQEGVLAVGKPLPDWLSSCEHNLRLCEKCQNIIVSAKEDIAAKSADHTMEQFYCKLWECRYKCDNLIGIYAKIANSLRNGDSTYTLDEGNVKRVELIKQFKILDTLSERIAGIKTSSSTQQKVQNNIRQASRSYLQDNLPATTPLPDIEEINNIQEKRLEETKAAIQLQKQEALRAQITYPTPAKAATSASTELQPSNSDGWSTKSKRAEITRDISLDKSREKAREGWTGEAVQPQRSGHPLLEQKEILRGYLRQAIRDNRQEETETLKQNLLLILEEIKSLGLDDS